MSNVALPFTIHYIVRGRKSNYRHYIELLENSCVILKLRNIIVYSKVTGCIFCVSCGDAIESYFSNHKRCSFTCAALRVETNVFVQLFAEISTSVRLCSAMLFLRTVTAKCAFVRDLGGDIFEVGCTRPTKSSLSIPGIRGYERLASFRCTFQDVIVSRENARNTSST